MRTRMKLSTVLASAAISLAAPTASSEPCDISQTKCALNDGKCNIKFRNVTGQTSGSGNGTDLSQRSYAVTIKVKAMKDNGNTAGNVLSIDAASNKTMNIDKKANKDFKNIKVTSVTNRTIAPVTLDCGAVKAVLNGNGTCKIFHGVREPFSDSFDYRLGYNCDAGNVAGPG